MVWLIEPDCLIGNSLLGTMGVIGLTLQTVYDSVWVFTLSKTAYCMLGGGQMVDGAGVARDLLMGMEAICKQGLASKWANSARRIDPAWITTMAGRIWLTIGLQLSRCSVRTSLLACVYTPLMWWRIPKALLSWATRMVWPGMISLPWAWPDW